MKTPLTGIRALTLDFYQTLARHRAGTGRGPALMRYFADAGIESDPWEHQVLYDVFARHKAEYDPGAPGDERRGYHRRLARRVFERLHVTGVDATDHAEPMWAILGPASLELFPEVPSVLAKLRAARVPMAVVSNWQHGLESFLVELGIREFFDHVLVSVEVGSTKPEPAIFLEACRRLGVPPAEVLHVGDTWLDDFEGGRGAGLQVVLVRRDDDEETGAPTISSLEQIPTLIGVV